MGCSEGLCTSSTECQVHHLSCKLCVVLRLEHQDPVAEKLPVGF